MGGLSRLHNLDFGFRQAAVAYAWIGPFPAPIFGTATDHNGPQLQVDGIYWRFPQTQWPQYGVIIPIQATQWAV